MSRQLPTLAALGVVMGLVFALAPSEPERHLPTPQTVMPLAKGGRVVVDLQDGASERDLARIEQIIGADLDWTHPEAVDEALAEGWVDNVARAVTLLEGHPLVEVAEPEIVLHATNYPNDPMYDRQWHLRAMGAPEGWASTARGEGVVVAVVDTGVARVEDLEGTEMLKGESFVPGTRSSTDDQGHGTHVAGTIAQTTNNGKGVAGVAPDATILPVKVLSKYGFGSASWIAAGIDYAADEGADVINLSLGGGYSSVIHNAVKKARAKGVLVVAAAGDSGPRKGVGYPGGLEETIGVSATGPDGELAPYSSWGKGVDIAAPGGNKKKSGGGVLQNTIDGRGGDHYVEFQGTSMATPHVAGAAAVLLSQGIAADAVERMLLDSARGDGWNEKFGHGHLDLGAAIKSNASSGGTLFVLGSIFALLIAQLAVTRRRFQLVSAGFAGWAAGGLFFLDWLPMPRFAPIDALTRPFLELPAVFSLPELVHFPLWLSAALPLVVAFTLGAFAKTRPLALGVTVGVGAHLLHGAATGTLSPWWLPTAFGTIWLVGNALACGLLGLGLAGAQKLDDGER